MRIVTYNIPSCRRRDGQVDAARIADAVAEADIIGLQEVDRFARRSGDMDKAIGARRRAHDRGGRRTSDRYVTVAGPHDRVIARP